MKRIILWIIGIAIISSFTITIGAKTVEIPKINQAGKKNESMVKRNMYICEDVEEHWVTPQITDQFPSQRENFRKVFPQVIKPEKIMPLSPHWKRHTENHGSLERNVKRGEDILVGENGYCPSIDRDESNGDLYIAVLRDDGVHPHQYIRIKKSVDNGDTWPTWCEFYSLTVEYNLPSIAVCSDKICVVYMRGQELHSFWIKKDLSDYGFSTITTENSSHPSVRSRIPGSSNIVDLSYMDIQNSSVKYCWSGDCGETWNCPPGEVDSGDFGIRFDGAISFKVYPDYYIYITYFSWSDNILYVSRSPEGGTNWERVLEVNADIRYPVIEVEETTDSPAPVLVYALYYNNSPITDLFFAFSYELGNTDTWEGYYWNDPDYDQWWPALGVSPVSSNPYFHVSYWDLYDDNVARVWALRAPATDLLDWESNICSSDAVAPNLMTDGKLAVAVSGNDIEDLQAWEDARTGGDHDTYFNKSFDSGVDEPHSIVPKVYLSQNFPNPFKATTSIKYYLPKSSKAKIQIYNVKGKLVETLMNGNEKAGSHTIYWDGRDDAGNQLLNGIYFFQLKVGEFTATRKMLIIR